MQQQRQSLLRRLLLLRPIFKPSNSARPFTRHSNLTFRARPQLPFLSVPLAGRSHQFRYLTTERKQWLKHEVLLGLKYTVYAWAIVGLSTVVYWTIQQEWLERKYPTPPEWSLLTRLRFRLAKWAPDRKDQVQTDWVQIASYAKNVLERLEDEKIDGAGLRLLEDDGTVMDGFDSPAYDITAKSEPWRRGYYEVLMLCGKAAEHLDSQVVDKTRHLVFPADQVRGPSNPNPKPIAFGSPSAPHEDDCEPAFEKPDGFYMRILKTRGFTPKQKLDAALEYATWLDFKNSPDAAEKMYRWALSLASERLPPAMWPYDAQTYVLRDDGPAPSANVLAVLTALAAHKARNGDIATALPILISILRARRALPQPHPKRKPESPLSPEWWEHQHASPWTLSNMRSVAKRLLFPPAYPPPPDDGESPPIRDAQELCEEAGLNLYIGEIIYASKSIGSSTSREDGLAWTREAVDLAEEQLHKLSPPSEDNSKAVMMARKTCRDCLSSGLDNWAKMVSRLAREEREKEEHKQGGSKSSSTSWLGLWGEGQRPDMDTPGRWAAEENVVRERTRRAQELLEELEAPKTNIMNLFQA
ncbi:hypothetical protein F5X96DRAFT_616290 [Biscogniauxia mediterranea]|nr:hypothetical protein F5X96DRAFT_616290 [Biscogniauxia mediterranea]